MYILYINQCGCYQSKSKQKINNRFLKAYLTQSYEGSCSVRLCNPMDRSLPGSSVHGIFQARVLEWGAISFSRRSSQPRDRTQVFHIAGWRFTVWATREHSLKSLAKIPKNVLRPYTDRQWTLYSLLRGSNHIKASLSVLFLWLTFFFIVLCISRSARSDSETPCTVALQAPLSVDASRQKDCSG